MLGKVTDFPHICHKKSFPPLGVWRLYSSLAFLPRMGYHAGAGLLLAVFISQINAIMRAFLFRSGSYKHYFDAVLKHSASGWNF
jgi:hypothetical protein